ARGARDGEPGGRAMSDRFDRPLAEVPTVAPTYLSLATIDEALASMAPPGERLATGIPALDKSSRCGLALGCVYTFLGPPGAGKTVMLCQLCRRFAERYGALVIGLFFDEGAWQAALMMAEGLGFERRDLENDYANIQPEVRTRTADLDIRLPRPADPDTVLDSVDRWLDGVDTTARRIVIAIDGVQTARVSRGEASKTRMERADAVMEKARELAQRHHAVVLLSSKANRASWSHKDPADNLDALAGGLDSSSIEYASDAVFFMSRDQGRLVVCKNRPGDGSTPTIALEFDRDRACFAETDQEVARAEAEELEQARAEAAWSADEAKVLQAVRKFPGRSQRALRPLARIGSNRLGAVLEELERKGRLQHVEKGWHVVESVTGERERG
nr:AAA family ATPase [Acidobacteriota bacterium]